jgi:hypothetical protein
MVDRSYSGGRAMRDRDDIQSGNRGFCMRDFEMFLVTLIVLAIVVVLVSSSQTSTSITAVTNAIKTFTQNVVGQPATKPI